MSRNISPNMPGMTTYEDALRYLNGLQSSPDVIRARQKYRDRDLKKSDALEKMMRWLAALGYQPTDLDRMNIAHVAGTKGKGSTCILLNNIIMQRFRDLKHPINIGLYTSPHLREVNERIRINSIPISKDDFAQYVTEVREKLESSKNFEQDGMPPYFRFLTLMAFHYFMSKDVQVAIVEVGVGGQFDSTNVISNPLAVGITAIHLDHQSQLGNTLEEIAWHKAGILKSSARAFTVVQESMVHRVINERASMLGLRIAIVEDSKCLPTDMTMFKHQRENITMAMHLATAIFDKLLGSITSCQAFDSEISHALSSSLVRAALRGTGLPGRGEVVKSVGATWFLDGAHTIASASLATGQFVRYFFQREISISAETPRRSSVLVFNQQSQGRDSLGLLTAIEEQLRLGYHALPSLVIFCTNRVRGDTAGLESLHNGNTDSGVVEKLQVQNHCRVIWERLYPSAKIEVSPHVEHAVSSVKRHYMTTTDEVVVLVIGSVHLVGAFYEVLDLTASIYHHPMD